ncbi:hypothetical protein IT413_05480 [Candidatus Peregrinibacteria bacterium]|nr:hypothetical protein [Candidatus Peregrinibacteria bacterium]
MPFSNYGPLVDPNSPPTIQALYQGTTPDFSFESPSPYNKISKTKALTKLVADVIVLGFIIYSVMNNQVFKSISWNTVWTDILSELKLSNDESQIFYVFGGIILLIGISYLVGIISNIKKLFINEQFWYIGTANQLIISNTKKSDSIHWEEFKSQTDYQSTPTGDILSIKLKSNRSVLNIIQQKQGILKAFDAIDIINPPNSMEVKRLIEKRIKEHTNEPTTEEKTLEEFKRMGQQSQQSIL